jgi:hypothetical protein
MLLYQSFLEELKEKIEAMPTALFASRGLDKEAILADKDVMVQLWAIYQKSIEDYECDADWSARDALKDVFGIQHDDELVFEEYALHVVRGVAGDVYECFGSRDELREAVVKWLLPDELRRGELDRLTKFNIKHLNKGTHAENSLRNIHVCAYPF